MVGVGVVRGVVRMVGGGDGYSHHAGTFSDDDGHHTLGPMSYVCTFKWRVQSLLNPCDMPTVQRDFISKHYVAGGRGAGGPLTTVW